jgi:hypothetical protein
MKKILFAVLLFSSCKKDSQNVAIQIKETITGTPVSGASVLLQRCGDLLGCAFPVTEFSGTTDNNGICQVPQDKWDIINPTWEGAIVVNKTGYWSEQFPKSTSIAICPIGWIRLHIISGTNYPPGSALEIEVSRHSSPPLVSLGNFNTAADSSVLIMAFGNQMNKIDWKVWANDGTGTAANSGTWQQQVPGRDTVHYTLSY